MTLTELRRRWELRRDEWSRFGVAVDGAKLAGEIVSDLEALAASHDAELLTPRQAAAASGYHTESITRLIRAGKLENHGTRRRPLVKASELPKKAPARRGVAKTRSTHVVSSPSTADEIARGAIAGRIGR